MRIVVTLPAYHEEQTIAAAIQEIHEALKGYPYSIHVLDDGSRDKTAAIARSLGAMVTSHPRNFGLAEAFREEMRQALQRKADIIIHTDADLQYPARHIPEMIAALKKGNDLVLGSRFAGRIESMPLLKRLGNKAFSRVISHIAGIRVTDAQTGFRAFTPAVARLPIISGYTYTQEQIIRAARAKLRIAEVPISARKTRQSRLMRNPFSYAYRVWITIMRIYRDFEPLKFFGGIGLFLFLVSFLFAVYTLIFTIHFGISALDKIIPTLLVTVFFLLSGLQIILFGFLADKQRS